MGFRFRKSVRLFPGVRLNFSTGGMSVSAGVPGMTMNFGPRGRRTTVGLPGSGLSYSTFTPWGAPARPSSRPSPSYPPSPPPAPVPYTPQPSPSAPPSPPINEIRSADIAQLTSPDLAGLKTMLVEAQAQRASLDLDFKRAIDVRAAAWRALERRSKPPLSWLPGDAEKKRAAMLEAELDALEVAETRAMSSVSIDFGLDEATIEAYRKLEIAFDGLRACKMVWDVTGSQSVDMAATRSRASNSISRSPVIVSLLFNGAVKTAQAGLRFENANGGDLEVFPGVMIVRDKAGSDIAFLDMRDVEVECAITPFIEDGEVPSDAKVANHVWEKSNADGSQDRRFKENRQLPLVDYGSLLFGSRFGLKEVYQFSDASKVRPFVSAWKDFQTALIAFARRAPNSQLPVAPPTPPTEEALRALLPPLPPVSGAWGALAATIAAAIISAVYLAHLGGGARPDQPSPAERSVARQAAPAPVAPREEPSPAAGAPAAAQQPAPMAPPVQSPMAPPPTSARQETSSAREQVVVAKVANLRAAPDRGSPVVSVEKPGRRLDVFARSGDWVQVGDGAPSGWVHRSLLGPDR